MSESPTGEGAHLGSESVGFPTTVVGEAVSSSVVLYAPDPAEWSAENNWESTFGEPSYDYELSVDGDFSLEASRVSIDEHASKQITIRFTPSAVGTRTGTLTVTRGGDTMTATLTGVALAADEPYWDGGATELDFGAVSVGGTLTATALVRVPSSDDTTELALTITVSGGAFTSSVASATLSAGGTLSILVTFEPSAEQAYDGTLTVAWTRGDASGTLTLALSGEGVEDEDELAETSSEESSTRAVLYVPTYESLLALGEPYELDSSTVSQKGFTISTTRHVFLRAEKSATVQANGLVWLQSNESSTYALSAKRSYYVAGSSLYLGGGGYVGLMAGFYDEPVDTTDASENADPDAPSSIEGIETAFILSNVSWTALALTVTIVDYLKSLHDYTYLGHGERGGWEGFKAKAALAASFSSAITQTGYFVYKYAYTGYEYATEGQSSFFKALDISSQAGILAGTPSVMTIMGMLGASYRSPNTTLFGAVGVAVEGNVTATLDSVFGQTAVTAGTDLTIRSPLETKIAPRLNDASFYGRTVQLGGIVPADRQQPTTELTIDALNEVSLTAKVGTVALTASPATLGSLSVKALASATLKSDLATKVYAVAGYRIECNPAGVTISGPTGALVSLTPAAIVLGPAASPIKLTPALADVGNSAIMITSGGLTAITTKMDLL